MMNIFDYLDYYIKYNSKDPFSIANSKDEAVKRMLNRDEYEIYESIKESDKARLIKFS